MRPTHGSKKRKRRQVTVLAPLYLALLLGTNLLRPGAAAPVLFLFSVALVAVAGALRPVRGRLLRAYVAHRRNPWPEQFKVDQVTKLRMIGLPAVAVIGAVAALTSTPYGRPGP